MSLRVLRVFLASLVFSLALTGCEACDAFVGQARAEPSGPPGRELGLMPAGLGLRWPVRPDVDEEVEVSSDAELNGPWAVSRVRLKVSGQIDQLIIDADDVEIVADEAMFIRTLIVMPGHSRIHVRGGAYGQIVVEGPTELLPPPPEWQAVDMVEDVLIEDVTVNAVSSGLSGVLLRGRRVALVDSRVDALFHAVFVGDTAPVPSVDVIVAGCSLFSQGEEPTVSFNDVHRGVVVDSWLENPRLSTLALHGESRWLVTSGNTLVGGGLTLATDPRDELEQVWFWTSEGHHSTPDWIAAEPDRISGLVLSSNLVFSDTTSCVWCQPEHESHVVQNNRLRSYRAPPERP